MSMQEVMDKELEQAVALLDEANDLLLKMFGLTGDEDD